MTTHRTITGTIVTRSVPTAFVAEVTPAGAKHRESRRGEWMKLSLDEAAIVYALREERAAA